MAKLAINGGTKIRETLFPSYDVIGEEECHAVQSVMETGVLSKYVGCWDECFYGGPKVRQLEAEWAAYFGAKHAVAVNSATSALICAVGAAGIEPGEEVIVSPYTMTASATAPLIYNAIPVFADIEEDYYCISPASIEERITEKTKAIIVVNIFGQPYNANEINRIAKEHDLTIIEDNAQGPGAVYNGKYTGTLGDIGVFSLNYHKHIHCGEGGIAVTDDDILAERMRLIRNHAEAVIEDMGYNNLCNMIGFNMRMTEIEAAIACEQLKKLDSLVDERIDNVEYIYEKLIDVPCVKNPGKRDNSKHVYYMQPFVYDEKKCGVQRERFIEAVKAELMPSIRRESEGVLIECGYVRPLYLQPLFQKRIGYGSSDFSFRNSTVTYEKGICPNCERAHDRDIITNDLIYPGMSRKDLDDVIAAFVKVYENSEELRE